MKSDDQHGGGRLRALRKERAWTQHDVAERLDRLAQLVENVHVGVNADMVSKWERGEKRPSALYVRLLSGLYQTSPADLGLSATIEPADTRLVASVATAGVLDMLQPPGGTPAVLQLLLPQMLELGRQ